MLESSCFSSLVEKQAGRRKRPAQGPQLVAELVRAQGSARAVRFCRPILPSVAELGQAFPLRWGTGDCAPARSLLKNVLEKGGLSPFWPSFDYVLLDSTKPKI